jgi:hypothetical protein
MSLQILTLQLEGITASDCLSWCRDPDPPAFHLGLRSICLDADPLGPTITAILDWDHAAPELATAARAAQARLSSWVCFRMRRAQAKTRFRQRPASDGGQGWTQEPTLTGTGPPRQVSGPCMTPHLASTGYLAWKHLSRVRQTFISGERNP